MIAATPALAHGVAEAEAIALRQSAGPYSVSVFVGELDAVRVAAHATVTGDTDRAPTVVVRSDGGVTAVELIAGADGSGWVAEFEANAGDELVVGWGPANGDDVGERVIVLSSPEAPVWFIGLLGIITPPGVWFGYWLMKRRRRAFGLAPSSVTR